MAALPPAKLEQLKRAMVAPIFQAIPAVIVALDGNPAETDEQILASFAIPDSLDGLLP